MSILKSEGVKTDKDIERKENYRLITLMLMNTKTSTAQQKIKNVNPVICKNNFMP